MMVGLSGLPSSAAITCTWTKDTPDATVPSESFSDIAAASADSAWVVGTHYNSTYSRYMGHIQEWNGTQWTQATLPAPTGVHEQLNGVTRVPGTTEAWAVGWSRQANGEERGLVLRRTATGWESVPVPTVDGGLAAVTARSATDAWAVGWKGNNGWILHWDGVEWTTAASPTATLLTDVVLMAAPRVWVVGWSRAGSFDTTLSMRWNGTSWQRVAVPDVAEQNNILRGVTRVPGTSTMWAVGYRRDPEVPSFGRSQIFKWTGTEWKAITHLTTGYALESVEAVGTSQAWAFGMRKLSTGQLQPLILKWNGTSWARVTQPSGFYWPEGSTGVPGSTRIWATGADDEEQSVIIRACG
jgi:hypothetical protein